MLIVGGWSAYQTAYRFLSKREAFPAFDIPIICLPATINNNLPGSELSVGADTALNSIVEAVDKIKQSAVASNRCFVVEVMGRYCGYLTLMGGLSTGAERVYLNEEGVTLADLKDDLDHLVQGFQAGQTPRAHHPQRDGQRDLHDPVHVARSSRKRAAISSRSARPSSVTSSRAGARPRLTGSWRRGSPNGASTTSSTRSSTTAARCPPSVSRGDHPDPRPEGSPEVG